MARLEKVLVLDNEAQARLLEGVLTEKGIPFVLRSFHDTAYDGIFQAEMGWGQVEAPPEHAEEIRVIARDLLEGTE